MEHLDLEVILGRMQHSLNAAFRPQFLALCDQLTSTEAEQQTVQRDSTQPEPARTKGKTYNLSSERWNVDIRESAPRAVLSGNDWTRFLNDDIINCYLAIMADHEDYYRRHTGKNLIIYDTHQFTAFISNRDKWQERLRNDKYNVPWSILCNATFLIPIHDSGIHWALVIYDTSEASMTYYDSMAAKGQAGAETVRQGSTERRRLQLIYEFVSTMAVRGGGTLPEPIYLILGTPHQTDSFSCGVFVCQFAKSLFLQRNSFDSEPEDLKQHRMLMIDELTDRRIDGVVFETPTLESETQGLDDEDPPDILKLGRTDGQESK